MISNQKLFRGLALSTVVYLISDGAIELLLSMDNSASQAVQKEYTLWWIITAMVWGVISTMGDASARVLAIAESIFLGINMAVQVYHGDIESQNDQMRLAVRAVFCIGFLVNILQSEDTFRFPESSKLRTWAFFSAASWAVTYIGLQVTLGCMDWYWAAWDVSTQAGRDYIQRWIMAAALVHITHFCCDYEANLQMERFLIVPFMLIQFLYVTPMGISLAASAAGSEHEIAVFTVFYGAMFLDLCVAIWASRIFEPDFEEWHMIAYALRWLYMAIVPQFFPSYKLLQGVFGTHTVTTGDAWMYFYLACLFYAVSKSDVFTQQRIQDIMFWLVVGRSIGSNLGYLNIPAGNGLIDGFLFLDCVYVIATRIHTGQLTLDSLKEMCMDLVTMKHFKEAVGEFEDGTALSPKSKSSPAIKPDSMKGMKRGRSKTPMKK